MAECACVAATTDNDNVVYPPWASYDEKFGVVAEYDEGFGSVDGDA